MGASQPHTHIQRKRERDTQTRTRESERARAPEREREKHDSVAIKPLTEFLGVSFFILEIMGENAPWWPGGVSGADLALGLDFRDLQVLFQANAILFGTKL